MNHRSSIHPAPRAFSLIEVLIAVVVLAIGLLGLAAVFPVVLSQQRATADAVQGVSMERSVGDVLARHAAMSKRPRVILEEMPPLAGAAANPSGWEQLVADGDWSEIIPSTTYGIWVLPERTGSINPSGTGFDVGADGSLGVTGQIVIPVSERLIPTPTGADAAPRYVWDAALRRIQIGPTPVRTPAAVREAQLRNDQIEAAVFVRRVDPGIRPPQGQTLAQSLISGDRLAVAADSRGRPTNDGSPANGNIYSTIQTIDFDVPNAERLDQIQLGQSDLRAFALQVGQKLVSQTGSIHTVTEVIRTPGRAADTAIITPAIGRDLYDLQQQLNSAGQGFQMLFTPQIPASVNIVKLGN